MGFEPMNTDFADQRVSHFAIGARDAAPVNQWRGYKFLQTSVAARSCADTV